MRVRKILVIEGLLNLVIATCKLAVGLITGSTAIMADAAHSLSDLANNIFAWLAIRIAESPADESHPYGHQKFEQLAVFFLASLLTVVAFEVAINAIKRFAEPVEHSSVGLVILLLVLCINIGLTFWERHWAIKLDSDILHADASHTLSDVLTSLAVIAGWQLATLGYYWLDSVFALIVSALICYLALNLFRRAIPTLVDQNNVSLENIKRAIAALEGVEAVGKVRSRVSGKSQMADVTFYVDAKLSTQQSHKIADKVEHLLANKFDIQDVVVHIEPSIESTCVEQP